MGSIAAICLASDKECLWRLRKQPARTIALISLLLFMSSFVGVSHPSSCEALKAGVAAVCQALEIADESCEPELEKDCQPFLESGFRLPPETLIRRTHRWAVGAIPVSPGGSPISVRGPPRLFFI